MSVLITYQISVSSIILSSFTKREVVLSPTFPLSLSNQSHEKKRLRRLHKRKVRMRRFKHHILIIELPRTSDSHTWVREGMTVVLS